MTESFNTLATWFRSFSMADAHRAPVHRQVIEALSDDLNTPKAIAELHALHKADRDQDLKGALSLLGFKGHIENPKFAVGIEAVAIEQALGARNAARARRDFKESDRIRDELLAKGIVLKDGPTGTTWEVKR